MADQPKLVDADTTPPDEFSLIKTLFLPLTGGRAEAAGLLDDAAFVTSRPGQEQVITTDQMIVGRHAMADEPYDALAQRCLRRAVSDLAAKGATPDLYFLSIAWPETVTYEEMRTFCAGLLADQAKFGIRLAGGDTAKTDGALSVAMTAIGWAPEGGSIRRSGAEPGDVVMVTGAIGDAMAGLKALMGQLPDGLSDEAKAHVIDRYQKPQPRTEMIEALRGKASASIDVSDGLVADLEHLAEASQVKIEIDLERVPISTTVKDWVELAENPVEAFGQVVNGGDDYEIVFTAPAREAANIALAAKAVDLDVTPIGRVWPGQGVVCNLHGQPFPVSSRGFRHF